MEYFMKWDSQVSFNAYLSSSCKSFHFLYTNLHDVLKLIRGLKLKSRASYDQFSSKSVKRCNRYGIDSIKYNINHSL